MLSLFVYKVYRVVFSLNKNFPLIIMVKKVATTMFYMTSFVFLFLVGANFSSAQDYMTDSFECPTDVISEAKEKCSVLVDDQAVEDCVRKNLVSAKKDGECGDASDFRKKDSITTHHEEPNVDFHREREADTRMIGEIFGKAVGMLISLSQEDLPDDMKSRVQDALLWFSGAVGDISRGGDVGKLVAQAKDHLHEIISMMNMHPGMEPGMGPRSEDGPMFDGPNVEEMKMEIEDMLAMSEEMLNKIPLAFKRMSEKGYEIDGWKEEVDAARERLREMRSICKNALDSEDREDFHKCFEGFKNFFERHMRKLEMLAVKNAPHQVIEEIDEEFGFDDYGPKDHGPPPMHGVNEDFPPPMHDPMYDRSTGEQFDGYMGPPTHITVPPEFIDPGPDFYHRPDSDDDMWRPKPMPEPMPYYPPPPRWKDDMNSDWDDDDIQIHDMGPGRMRNLTDPYITKPYYPSPLPPPPPIGDSTMPHDAAGGGTFLPGGGMPLPPPPPPTGPIGDGGGQYLPSGGFLPPPPPPPPPIGDNMMPQGFGADGIADY